MLPFLKFWEEEEEEEEKRTNSSFCSINPEANIVGLKIVTSPDTDNIVESIDLRVITRTTRSVLTLTLIGRHRKPSRSMSKPPPAHYGGGEDVLSACSSVYGGGQRRQKFPPPLTFLSTSTINGKNHLSCLPWRLERMTTLENGTTRLVIREKRFYFHHRYETTREDGTLKLKLLSFCRSNSNEDLGKVKMTRSAISNSISKEKVAEEDVELFQTVWPSTGDEEEKEEMEEFPKENVPWSTSCSMELSSTVSEPSKVGKGCYSKPLHLLPLNRMRPVAT